MSRRHTVVSLAMRYAALCGAILASFVLCAPATSAQNSSGARPKPGDRATAGNKQPDFNSAIKYIVFIVKENRSFDGYFGAYPGEGVYGATTGVISTGQVIPLFHAGDRYPRDFNHSWEGLVQAIDYGRMDDFDLPTQFPCSVNGDYMCYSQNYQEDLPNYWQYAQQYVLADEMFSSEPGPSYPQHLYAVAASSAGVIGEGTVPPGQNPACDSPPGSSVSILDLAGNITDQYPCFNVQTMADTLDAAGVSWKSYTDLESVWNGYLSISHVRHSSDWNTNIVKQTTFLGAVEDGELPAVSWLIPDNADSEHPTASICKGENWTVEQINAIMNSPYWPSVAIFVTWDDPDGVYDHIAPPVLDEYGLGPRVPMLIISPYVKGGYVSHTVYETSSVLKFIEERFNLPYLTERDATANDILDAFDFTQTPLPPLVLSTRACPVNSQSSIPFSSQQVGLPSPVRSILLTNFNSTTLTINSVKATGDFTQSNNCRGSLPPNPANPPDCVVSVIFTPAASGVRTGTLTITDSDPSSPQVVQLSGVGTKVVLSPSLLNFGMSVVGSASSSQTAILMNEGSAPVTIGSITGTPDYQVSNNCGASVPAHGQCTISAVFTPTTSGKRYGALTVTTSDSTTPQIVNMTGIGTEVGLEPESLQFNSQGVGTSSSGQTVTLTNFGSTALQVGGLFFVGSTGSEPGEATTDFSQTNNCGSTVGAGASCTINVEFDPSGLGARSATLNVTDNYADSPQQVALSGTGIASPNNAVPFIDLLSPTTARPGSTSVQLTVGGTGFVSGSVVEWNGSALSTTYQSNHLLTATIPSSRLTKANTARVTVVNPTPGGGTSTVGFFTIIKVEQQVTFSRTDIAVGASPVGVVTGDFNGDGTQDVAVANSGSNMLSILLGTGNGQFTAAASPATGRQPVSLAAGDFNNDGKLDLAVGNLQDNAVTILLGNGDGTFKAAGPACSTVYPVSIAAGDFNNDGYLDVAVANSVEPEVSILLGAGNGTLLPTSTPSGEGTDPQAVVLGGFASDGYLDLAEVNSVDLTMVALLGNADGTFRVASQNPPATGSVPLAIAAGDVNTDGILDIVVANQSDNTTSVYLGNGDGTFQPQVVFKVGKGPSALALADMDGHGPLDIVTANQQANTMSVLRGSGAGSFKTRVDYRVGAAPSGIAVADFNGDGRLDAVTTNSAAGTISVMLQSGTGEP